MYEPCPFFGGNRKGSRRLIQGVFEYRPKPLFDHVEALVFVECSNVRLEYLHSCTFIPRYKGCLCRVYDKPLRKLIGVGPQSYTPPGN